MGLDISHCKATLEKPKIFNLFNLGDDKYYSNAAYIKEGYWDFNVEFSHFEKYIQTIEIPIEIQTVVIANGSENFEKTRNHFQFSSSRTIIYNKTSKDLESQITEFENQNGLQNFDKCIENMKVGWSILKYYTLEKKEGFYFKEVGHQRKGMEPEFMDRFYKIEEEIYNFALKEDFDYAMNCVIESEKHSIQKVPSTLKKEFKTNFIDTFENGASFISLSY